LSAVQAEHIAERTQQARGAFFIAPPQIAEFALGMA